MQSILLSGGTKTDRATYISNNFPNGQYLPIHISDEKTISLESISSLIQNLFTTSPLPRLVWIEEADKLSSPAQHALLKILEEPPSNTTFILSLTNSSSLIETIRSRCFEIKLESGSDVTDEAPLLLIKKLLTASPGERISLISTIPRQREELESWLSSASSGLRSKITPTASDSQLKIVSSVLTQTTRASERVSANCNIYLVLCDFALSLPRAR